MNIVLLVASIFLLCIAQMIKILRWRLFIEVYEEPRNRNLVRALAFGNLVNLFLPFRIFGEIFRVIYSGKEMKNKYAFSLSTVIVDRILDVISVGIIFSIFYILKIPNKTIEKNLIFYILFSLIIIIVITIVYGLKKYVKAISLKIASLFNENIELNFLKFMWSLIWNFKDIFSKINKIKIITLTVMMWGFYAISYSLFSLFLITIGYHFNLVDIFILLFSNDTYGLNSIIKQIPFIFYIYMFSSILIMLFISKFIKIKIPSRIINSREEEYLNLLPNQNNKERLQFLEKYFLDKDKSYIENYLKINQNITIIRDFSAGSNATTMLCMKDDKMFYRKYAFEDKDKLYDQIVWIEMNKKLGLPLPNIVSQEKTDKYCYYDMPYNPNAMVLFEYSHSMPYENGWNIMKKALEKLSETVYTQNIRKADKETIYKYVDSKVTSNIEKIFESKIIKKLSKYDEIFINGRAYKNLSYYLKYLSKDYLYNIFKNDMYSDLHGDLTIENIVCVRNIAKDDFYIIDPNTGNVHDSANLDYGKLLQSIHGGYEFMMKTYDVSLEENKINFLFTKSHTYVYFYEKLNEYMNSQFSREQVKSIYFHEIIHWLRLMPYKIRKDSDRVLIFYSGLLMVLNDVIEMYGDDNEKE
ncbi:lysylphosphatidylglycerol synthase transmembrane domain-containing protein [Leptotrichia trevisanii]|uniref:Phosphatidylglycerol lysyltransferase n=1 Tax=Leptotrichia trevisanii TaxID=109328 RepID=A0A510JXV3_9FUSO|nr:lysylphosphatidylglycerol synthase transmembrane domain-containing protein [Leptotrichia trevisanii]BBM44014.1 hypothetical protein JMUB3870_0104 [Leptotrichia trevisanii]